MTSTGILLVWTLGILGGVIGAAFGLHDGRARRWSYFKIAVAVLLLLGAPFLLMPANGVVPFREFIFAGGGALAGMYAFCWFLGRGLLKRTA